jgi:hypothetical protein
MIFSPAGKQAPSEILLDFGFQPVCSHFLQRPNERVERHPLALAVCPETGLVHLHAPFPTEALVPRFDWIKYNEPEEHLDRMVEKIASLPGITPQSSICGISYKDDSTLARLEKLGFGHTWRIAPPADLEITSQNANIESVQQALTEGRCRHIAQTRGQADVVIVRHILEHAEAPEEFLSALKTLLAPNGYLILEVPDCQKSMERMDYTMAWEEHTLYFTEASLRNFCCASGLEAFLLYRHPYPFEDSLIGFFREGGTQPTMQSTAQAEEEIARARRYAAGFPGYKANVQEFFRRRAPEGIALFGAGHLTASFLNLLEVGQYVRFVADDNPHKQGLFLPGSGTPVRPHSALAEEGVRLCLLGVNPIVEDALLKKLGGRGVTFYSLFPGSAHFYLLPHG